ncbi:ABC transporter substrate-binding protein [Brachybacterium vulturis]|uniref:ABC transporter substrate-binding protein n=1 Tax=Brachybacterium vulturis TaxID=2017484 RepID=A0A291GJM0_9MICO|nr:ABC transporter substrate-binding protein [Brachybacterium vulturis]ATG50174.1 ABC transporter substrate-binding protein [Brachybacterium vulturis]
MTSSPTRRTVMTSLLGVLGLGATACTASGHGAQASGEDGGSDEGFPLTLTDCDAEVVLPAAPERVVLLDSAPVTTLAGLGVLDRVVARAGSFPEGYYDDDLTGRLAGIPVLSEDIDTTGHLQISQEVVIAQRPDLVLGLPDGVTREGLRAAGAEVLIPRSYCGGLEERARFEMLFEEISTYGAVFDRAAEAVALVGALQERIETAAALPLGVSTAAVLYASAGGGPLYAYGAPSMATAQLDALGIENVFAGTAQRVFESGTEPLLAADPDLLIVLHEGTVPEEELLTELLGSSRLDSLRAVQDSAVLPLLFNFTEPASPLIVDGLERIGDWLSEQEQAG